MVTRVSMVIFGRRGHGGLVVAVVSGDFGGLCLRGVC